jgi:DNA-binding transcriptional MerR regulator
MTTTQADEARRVAEDVADLVTLAQEKQGDATVVAAVTKVMDRHSGGEKTAGRCALAAQMLGVSVPTIRLWVERGLLEEVPSRPRKVSAVSLGQVLALTRHLEVAGEGRERLLRALETLRDRDLLTRARKAASQAKPEDLIVYDQSALAELRRR